MGKFEDIIISELKISGKATIMQDIIRDFFNQEIDIRNAERLVRKPTDTKPNSGDGFLSKVMTVDPDYSYNTKLKRMKPSDVGERDPNFAARREIQVDEAATVNSVQQFAKSIGLKPLSQEDAERVRLRWPEFIEAVKTKLKWDYGITKTETPPSEPTSDQPATDTEPEPPVNPVSKSLFKRGIEAAGRGLKGLGSTVAGAISQQDPYNPNINRNPFGNLGIDKLKFKQNQGKIDSKDIDKRMNQVRSRIGMIDASQQARVKELHDKFADTWVKVKPALRSNPEKNQKWKVYILRQLSELEKATGIQPNR